MLHYNLEGDRVRARSSAGTLGDKLLCLPDRDLGQERRDSIEPATWTMAGGGAKICKLCRCAEGMCQVGVEMPRTSDPQCRLHGVTGQASGAMPARLRQEAPPPPGEHKATASSLCLEKTARERPFQDNEGAVPSASRRRPNGGWHTGRDLCQQTSPGEGPLQDAQGFAPPV